MISRRDNLLVRPWEQRRYDNHRRKVQSATPAIDNKPPLPRQHVALKLKKKQKESERCQEIEKNNFNLLRRLSYVMRTSRVDNYWTTPQPNFLNRVSMYKVTGPKFDDLYIEKSRTEPEGPSTRKSKCFACTPQPLISVKIPEDRVPWEPERPSISKFRSKSVPVRKLEPVIEQRKISKSANCRLVKSVPKPTPPKPQTKNRLKNIYTKEPHNIVLSRGCLQLSVNFPSDTFVKLQEGSQEKILVQGACHCKNLTPFTV